MCHLILLMPVLSLPVFWLLPISQALPIYMIIAFVSGLLYWLIARALVRQPATGSESLVGAAAEVVSKLRPGDHAGYLVRSGGELWSADSPDPLQTGETVSITAVDGVRLIVGRGSDPNIPAEDSGRKANEWYCH